MRLLLVAALAAFLAGAAPARAGDVSTPSTRCAPDGTPAPTTGRGLAGCRRLDVRLPARATLTATPRTLRAGSRARLSGRLLGGRVPSPGKLFDARPDAAYPFAVGYSRSVKGRGR
jgi:hypothetical protein